jgi:hypothetical protein
MERKDEMQGLLVRVAADQSRGGGGWNGPIDTSSGDFVYAAIPETRPVHSGLNTPYIGICSALSRLHFSVPTRLIGTDMHLDPDFTYLTYGDQGKKAKQILSKLGPDDFLAFYAGLQDIRCKRLFYALIGLFIIQDIVSAVSVPQSQWHTNAHTRRILPPDAQDIVVHGRADVSGRLEQCIEIGDYRQGAYRVFQELLSAWGGLNVKNGYLQRSRQLPEFLDGKRFYTWFCAQNPVLIKQNN